MGYVAYYRVSSKQQGESGLGLESQRAIICHYLKCDDLVAEFTEVASAKDIDGRPQLQAAIDLCVSGGHTLAVAKIDRLSRRTEDALQIWGKLNQRLYSCDIPQENGKMPKFNLTMYMAFADRERELISIRTKAALGVLKNRGIKLGNDGEYLTNDGRKKGGDKLRQQAIKDYRSSSVFRTIKMMRDQGESYRTIAKRLNDDGVKTRETKVIDAKTGDVITRGGGKFYATTIKRILDRASA